MTTPADEGAEPSIDAEAARRGFIGLCAIGGVILGLGAQATAPARRLADKPWRLLVNEAVTGTSNLFIHTARYQPLAEYVAAQLPTRPQIDIEPVIDIERFLSLAQASRKPELVFGKSMNELATLVRDDGYQPLVRRAEPYQAAFIVARDSPLRSLADVGRTRAKVILPDEFAATTSVARAELRRQNAGDARIVHTRYQDAVAQQIANGSAQVGVVHPSIARRWTEAGGRVLAQTQPVVNWSVLASPAVPPADVAQLRAALLGMNTQAAGVLAALDIGRWAPAQRQDYLALLDYTKE